MHSPIGSVLTTSHCEFHTPLGQSIVRPSLEIQAPRMKPLQVYMSWVASTRNDMPLYDYLECLPTEMNAFRQNIPNRDGRKGNWTTTTTLPATSSSGRGYRRPRLIVESSLSEKGRTRSIKTRPTLQNFSSSKQQNIHHHYPSSQLLGLVPDSCKPTLLNTPVQLVCCISKSTPLLMCFYL